MSEDPNHDSNMAGRLFRLGDRVSTTLYGLGRITYWWFDQNIGYTYHVKLDEVRPDGYAHAEGDNKVIGLVQSALTEVPVVDQLGDLAR